MLMKLEDYNEYYIQDSDHYLIPKAVFIELYEEMANFREESREYKEVIDKAKYWVEDYMNEWDTDDDVWQELNELLILLEEVE